MPSNADIQYLKPTQEDRKASMRAYYHAVLKPKIQAKRAEKRKQPEVTFFY